MSIITCIFFVLFFLVGGICIVYETIQSSKERKSRFSDETMRTVCLMVISENFRKISDNLEDISKHIDFYSK